MGCILENVTGILAQTEGMESAMQVFLRTLEDFLPEFVWSVETLHAEDYLLPQSRVRVFLKGIRRLIAAAVPPALPPFGRRHLRQCAGEFPHTPRTDFTPLQQSNIKHYEKMIRDKVATGELDMDDLVVVSADRSEEGEYGCSIARNVAPTLTTHNAYLLIMSVQDVVRQTPDEEREFFRKVRDAERLSLQGLPLKMLHTLPRGKIVFATGNAYPVPLIIAVFQPMLMALSRPLQCVNQAALPGDGLPPPCRAAGRQAKLLVVFGNVVPCSLARPPCTSIWSFMRPNRIIDVRFRCRCSLHTQAEGYRKDSSVYPRRHGQHLWNDCKCGFC